MDNNSPTVDIKDYPPPQVCFICLDNKNLLKSNIHCGESIYHAICIDAYCKNKSTISCPICHNDISNNFKTEVIRECNFSFNFCEIIHMYKDIKRSFTVIIVMLIPVGFLLHHYYVHEKTGELLEIYTIYNALNVIICPIFVFSSYYGFKSAYEQYYDTNLSDYSDLMLKVCDVSWALSCILAPIGLMIMSSVYKYYPDDISTNSIEVSFFILMILPTGVCAVSFVFALLLLIMRIFEIIIKTVGKYCTCKTTKSTFVFDSTKCNVENI